jgi:predicted transcriptional regulator
MKTTGNKIKVGIATEEQVNREFIDAWHRAEWHQISTPEEHLYFLEPQTLLRMLSRHRLALLYMLRSHGKISIQALSKLLRRSYKNVYRDVQLLKKAGLIHQTTSKDIFVPWDKIGAEIDLSSGMDGYSDSKTGRA